MIPILIFLLGMLMNESELATKSFGEMVGIRETATNQEEANTYGNYEHRAYSREEVSKNGTPGMKVALPLAIPAYYVGKKTGMIEGSRSEPSLEQVKQAYTGYAEGMVTEHGVALANPMEVGRIMATDLVKGGVEAIKTAIPVWERTWQKVVDTVKETVSPSESNMPWNKTWQKEDVSVASTGTKENKLTDTSSYSVETLFPKLIQAESQGIHIDPDTGKLLKSPRGALGITQLMPETMAKPGYGVKPLKDHSEQEHIRFGKEYLQAMYNKFQDWEKALAAYNAGPGTIIKAEIRADKEGGTWKDKLPVPKETLNYLKKILGSK